MNQIEQSCLLNFYKSSFGQIIGHWPEFEITKWWIWLAAYRYYAECVSEYRFFRFVRWSDKSRNLKFIETLHTESLIVINKVGQSLAEVTRQVRG